jgi:ankyrin repeat protein
MDSLLTYEIIRSITSRLNFKDTLTLSECCRRLSSLFDYNHDPRLDDQFALGRAMHSNSPTLVYKLLHKVKNSNLGIPFVWACEKGHLAVVKLLIENHGIDSSGDELHGFEAAA